jgi:hypothetical protein
MTYLRLRVKWGQFAEEIEGLRNAFVDGRVTYELAKDRLAFLKDRKKADLRSIETLVPQEFGTDWKNQLERRLRFVELTYEYGLEELDLLVKNRKMGSMTWNDRASVDANETQEEPSRNKAAEATEVTKDIDSLLNKVFSRKCSGPIELRGFLRQLNPEERENWYEIETKAKHTHVLTVLIQYWMDGKRNLSEVIRCVELESGLKDIPFTLDYIRLLLRLNLIEEKG